MKFNCGLTAREREELAYERACAWHSHFAWWPVRIGPNDCRWLELVERRYAGSPYDFSWPQARHLWRYRPMQTVTRIELSP